MEFEGRLLFFMSIGKIAQNRTQVLGKNCNSAVAISAAW